MDAFLQKAYDEVRSAWRFRWIGLALAAVLAALGWLAAFALPDRYEARASVFVDTRTALRPVLQGVTVEQDVNVQLNYVRQSLLSGERLERIARISNVLPKGETDPRKIAETLDDFSKSLQLQMSSASNRESEREAGSVYSFVYRDNNRDRSLEVMQTVVNTFVEETIGGKRAGTQNAQKFLETQIKEYEDRLRDAENRLAEFKKANIGLMPTEQGGYFAQLQTELDLITRLENDLNVAMARRSELERQLRGESVIGASAVASASGATGSDTVSRINETQARLDELLLRFTEKYPDVVAARSTLEELQARRETEIERLRRGDAGAVASSGVSTHPVYQQIQLQLNQADVEVASLRGQLRQHREKAAELRKRLDVAPQVEAEFGQLNRDYDINKLQYTTLLANYEKAQLGERADDAGSVRFDVVEPPTAPYSPVFPKRILLLFGVLVAAMGAGGALCYVLHFLNPVVGSVLGLAEVVKVPVLGVVSPAFPQQGAARARRELWQFAGALGAFVFVFICVVTLNYFGLRLPGMA